MEPIPPRITMARTPMDSRKVNDSGLMNTCLAENSTPMMPAKDAPQAKARSFIRTSGTPMARAASSSSRIASHIGRAWEAIREGELAAPADDNGDEEKDEEVEVRAAGQAEWRRAGKSGG